MNFDYKKFQKICELKNVTPYVVSKATGIAQSTLSDWKYGKCEPKIEKIGKIANYFNVGVLYFADNEYFEAEYSIVSANSSLGTNLLTAFSGDRTIMDKFILKLQKSPSLKHFIELSCNAEDEDIEVVNVVLKKLLKNKSSGE